MGNFSPSTAVYAPFPCTTKRIAAMLWRCARATSPGFTLEKVNWRGCAGDLVGRGGLTSRMARRSACSIPMVSLAFNKPSRSGSHFQRYGASDECDETRVFQKPESWFFSHSLSSSASFIGFLLGYRHQDVFDIA